MAPKKKAPPSPATAVATIPEPKPNALATVSEQTLATIYEDADAGLDFGLGDTAIPFLRILQSNSPECLRGGAKYIEGAQAGMFLNIASGTLYDDEAGIVVIPVAFMRSYTEWRPRDAAPGGTGGGFVADYGTDGSLLKTTKRNDRNKNILPNGNELTEAGLYYLMVINPEDGTPERAALSLSSTQLKKARKWNSLIQAVTVPKPTGGVFTPALFYMSYQLSTRVESNAKGSWYGLHVEAAGPVLELEDGELLYTMAREYAKLAKGGDVKVNAQTLETEGELSTTGALQDEDDEPTPF